MREFLEPLMAGMAVGMVLYHLAQSTLAKMVDVHLWPSRWNSPNTIQPTYYVANIDGTYSEADPQPTLTPNEQGNAPRDGACLG